MADKRSLIINSVDGNGNKNQQSFTDVNPNASNADLKTFADMIVGVTQDTLVSAAAVEKTELKTKQNPNFRLIDSSFSYSDVLAGMADGEDPVVGYFMFDGDAVPYVKSNRSALAPLIYHCDVVNDGWRFLLLTHPVINESFDSNGVSEEMFFDKAKTDPIKKTGTITFALPETDTYAAAEVTVTITA